ncbi:MAG: succinate dehydrogenase, hydrophobic membrane anchor protein [Chiayiivirga sp.]|jgi:succinate dehydrogenase / fumarate reductase membrane anchor subunit|uniref:succinate dehydrogenase, hydrophobic membrane anchor protein n=1 Tax=Chiayiivirga sp. TaxID=2041042 RepID=UPI0025C0E47C|nr:succinate dehydrogenase, hydrophobic membrane anchor protein [Chiayiivirga sp.]MCI1709655.1 succinate dehydrogenase, hydrophobic membrane anchor protein [Chiayiivirga sp.]MCI1730056.1 succinate dehydrogenase, hydrophobic membrane anchor protein [Chiayiivirga sp.]
MSHSSSNLRDPLARVRGLGSARGGTQHWWVQRVTAVALALLTPWFLWLVLTLLGANHSTMRLSLAQPLNAVLMAAWVIALFWHAKLGVQVVIEDYVHTPALEIAAQLAVTFACALGALASLVAIGRIAFSA